MKLLYSSTSPYSAKVRMAAVYLGLGVESVPTKTDENAELVGNNPLGKIPVLIRDGERPIFDSRAIMQYFDRSAKSGLYPRKGEKRTEAEVLEALCDGITDCLLSIVYEKRTRPSEMQYQPNLPKTGKKLHGGHFALAALLGYLDLRFEGQWQRGRAKLKAWPKKFEQFFPEHKDMKPQA